MFSSSIKLNSSKHFLLEQCEEAEGPGSSQHSGVQLQSLTHLGGPAALSGVFSPEAYGKYMSSSWCSTHAPGSTDLVSGVPRGTYTLLSLMLVFHGHEPETHSGLSVTAQVKNRPVLSCSAIFLK